MNTSTKKSHQVWIDVLRTMAIMAVLVQHASDYYIAGQYGNDTAAYILNNLSRFHVPSFLMITGSLLLGRDISIKTVWAKYIRRIILAFCVWGAAYTAYNFASRIGSMSLIENVKTAVVDFVSGGTNRMWYLVMLVGIYALMPMLSTWLKNASDKEQRYALAVLIVVASILPTLTMFKPIRTVIELDLQRLSGCFPGILVFYFVAGYFCRENYQKFGSLTTNRACGFFLFISTLCLFVISIVEKKQVELSFFPVLVLTLFVFLLIRKQDDKYNNFTKYVVKNIADCTFGIYLIHTFIQYFMCHCGIEKVLFSFPAGLGIGLYTILLFLMSWGSVVLIRMCPLGRVVT